MRGSWHPTINKWHDESSIVHFIEGSDGIALCGKGNQKYSEGRNTTLGGPVQPEGRHRCETCKKLIRSRGLKNRGIMVAIIALLEHPNITAAEAYQVSQAIPEHAHEDFLADWYEESAPSIIASLKEAIREKRK